MIKKLVILWMVVHLVVLGGIPTGAQTGVETEEVVANVQEENQQIDVVVEQVQSIDTNNGTDTIVQDQNVTGNQIQQLTDPNEEGDDNQTEVDSINQEQSVEVTAEQSQSVENVETVEAVQDQDLSIEYNQSLNLAQEELQSQETIIVTDQNQSFKTENKTDYVDQTLKTEIETNQKGEINLEKNINENSQKTTVLTEQTHESETSGHATVQQQQSVEAIGNNEETEEEEEEEVNIKAAVSNGLEIIKEVSHYVVKIVQSIIVNDEKVDSLEGEYIVKNNSSILKELKYEQKYEWGILSIFNSIGLNTTEDNDLQSVLSSIIKLDFFIQNDKNQDQETPGEEEPENPGEETPREEEPEKPGEETPGEEEPEKPGEETPGEEEPEKPGEETPGEEEPKNPSEENPDEEEPVNPEDDRPGKQSPEPFPNEGKQEDFRKNPIPIFLDSDRDGVPNYLEIFKFKTDPFKNDTDDDGLSDEFEIMYHSATSFYYTFECMEYDWRDFVPATEVKVQKEDSEKWQEIQLSPLSNDIDQNGFLDHLEDFDGDGILNVEEQQLGTNPYIHNDNGNYVGPTGLELKEIMENAQKGC
ncbi:MAG: hypothetical protein WAM95_18680 [Bacillus sp. (in: firmicutes)]